MPGDVAAGASASVGMRCGKMKLSQLLTIFWGAVPASPARLHVDWPAAPHRYHSAMPQNQNHLIWLDMEMSGLDPEICRVLENGDRDHRTRI